MEVELHNAGLMPMQHPEEADLAIVEIGVLLPLLEMITLR